MAARDTFDRYRTWLVALAVLLGVALIVVAVIYWVEPAGSLPSFFPGHEEGSSHHHVKHGIAAFLVGLACLAFAWFNSGPKKSGTRTSDAN
jgi:UDP-N-acetylmuramyl pentapeptide phosphotransferase/UDP-N-acetylglucosamine-1-phosphate transferase